MKKIECIIKIKCDTGKEDELVNVMNIDDGIDNIQATACVDFFGDVLSNAILQLLGYANKNDKN